MRCNPACTMARFSPVRGMTSAMTPSAVSGSTSGEDLDHGAGDVFGSTPGSCKAACKLEGDACAAEFPAWILAAGQAGVHDGIGIGQLPVGAEVVVIGDDDVQAGIASGTDLVDGGDAAIDADDQVGSCFLEAKQRLAVEAVAFLEAIGHVGFKPGIRGSTLDDMPEDRAVAVMPSTS